MFSPLPFFKENFLACLLILQARMCCGGGELYKFVRYALTVMWWLSPPNLIGRRKKNTSKTIFFFLLLLPTQKYFLSFGRRPNIIWLEILFL